MMHHDSHLLKRKTGADFIGDMLVELGTQDIAVELTGREYDSLVQNATS